MKKLFFMTLTFMVLTTTYSAIAAECPNGTGTMGTWSIVKISHKNEIPDSCKDRQYTFGWNEGSPSTAQRACKSAFNIGAPEMDGALNFSSCYCLSRSSLNDVEMDNVCYIFFDYQ